MGIFCGLAQFTLLIAIVVGLIKPSLFIKKKLPVPRRLVIVVGCIALMVVVAAVTPEYEEAKVAEEETLPKEKAEQLEQAEELTPHKKELKCKVAVMIYLKRVLNDPDSFEEVSWSKVEETELGYTITHTFRAKNGFGAKILNQKTFYLNKQFIVTNVK